MIKTAMTYVTFTLLHQSHAPFSSAMIKRSTLVLFIVIVSAMVACKSVYPNQQPIDQRFPSMKGTGLDGTVHSFPDTLLGSPTVLLIGYTQRAQFDIDRWLLGIAQLERESSRSKGRKSMRLMELPTIEGLMPGLFANQIDNGMRKGIPQEDWPAVVTVYDDASIISQFFGTEKPDNARIVLLDDEARIKWVSDRGYSSKLVQKLYQSFHELRSK